MSLAFSNANLPSSSVSIWLAFAYYDTSCGAANQNFRKMGWWEIIPGGAVFLWNVDLRTVNRYAYFYAETAHDGINWSGNGNGWLSVNPLASFNQCAFDNTNNDQWVDFLQLDFSMFDFDKGRDLVVVLGPGAGQIGYIAGFNY